MGKLTEMLYDGRRQIGTASPASSKKQWVQQQASAFVRAAKSEIRKTFHFRNTIAALAVCALTSVGVYTVQDKIAAATPVYRVYIDGEYSGVVRDKALLEDQMVSYGALLKSNVKFLPVHQTVKSTNEWTVANAISESTKTMVDMVIVRVNGQDIVHVKDQETAEKLIKTLESKYVKADSNATVRTSEQVDFVPMRGDKQLLVSFETALSLVSQSKNERKTYVVSRGDSLWDIATKNEISVDELTQANPEIGDIDELSEGQRINLVAVEPLISVESVSEETREITTNYEVEYKDDNSLDVGTEKIIQEGKEGKKNQVLKVTRRNGVKQQEDVLSEQVVSEPVKEIISKGTRKQTYSSYSGGAAAAVSGSWAYPIGGGYISSQYGENRGGKAHNAIDIAASTGTPVYASNNGTVIQAGDYGDGYGNCIRISHSNGIVSIYGHLSSMNVSVGQAVQKGQRIGGVGSTGQSTGSHLHYEVRVNGVQVNPAPYM
ncbi:M23 family metallopeptidase [Tumebacillus permanentifrigoris]|uniref:Murein DD-endopeptidase MepM/ murein hydrolase activator NlpD n=1 Tax=Tumebacillus permanentifrigoris TaxID=378543 RepID=A0A316DAS4_9BACL|nr:M23 family metallopeptidase [Tumebacillus permanentifrigoris]PWK13001.1 murein DD-endopeptidase MepM/ murein hydrolase activator NlpD [Tumebacillus permanentifrigoris]